MSVSPETITFADECQELHAESEVLRDELGQLVKDVRQFANGLIRMGGVTGNIIISDIGSALLLIAKGE